MIIISFNLIFLIYSALVINLNQLGTLIMKYLLSKRPVYRLGPVWILITSTRSSWILTLVGHN